VSATPSVQSDAVPRGFRLASPRTALVGAKWVKWSAALFGLGILQMVLGAVATSHPWLGALHTINALAIYAASALIAHQAWTLHRTGNAPSAITPSG
jgi:heme A synthase